MSALATELLFELRIDIDTRRHLGPTPFGDRWVAAISGGTFEGPSLRGRVLPPSGDWPLFSADGAVRVDARALLETDDGALILMRYQGVKRPSPDEYHLRIAALFETSASQHAWLNFVVAVGIGQRTPTGIAYALHQVL